MSEQPQVVLRPVTEADLGHFDVGATPDSDPWNFFGWRRPGQVRRDFAENGLLGDEHGHLVVDAGGQLVGDVGWHLVRYGPPPTVPAYNIGIALRPEHRGKGYGSAAQHQLAAYLFATYAINRVEAGTDIENVAEQRALEKAGFTREGVLRGSQWRAGAFHDMVSYAKLRGE